MLSQIPIFFFHLFITIFRYQETKPLGLTLLQQSSNEITKKNSRKPVKKKDQKYIMKDGQETKNLGLKLRNNEIMKNLMKPAKKYIFKNSLELKNTKKRSPLLYVMTLRGICMHVASLVHSVHSVLIFSVYC
jgi:hypothetical protein